MFLVSYDQKIPFSSIKSGLVVLRLYLKSSDLQSYKNLDKDHLIYGKGKYKI